MAICLLLQTAFFNAVKVLGCILWPVWPLRGINRTVWDAKLLLTAGWLPCVDLCQHTFYACLMFGNTYIYNWPPYITVALISEVTVKKQLTIAQ